MGEQRECEGEGNEEPQVKRHTSGLEHLS
jgi:hypothetical protein